jgi:hypothetical protein
MLKAIKAAAVAAAKKTPQVVRDLTGIAAVGSISYGSWLITPAAGFIVGGTLVLVGVILMNMAERKEAE